MGCGAATVNGTADDGSVDAGGGVRFDAGAVGDDAMAVDATMVDATNDVPGRDVGPEAHVCPVVDDDVPPADVPASDAPYVVELAIGSQLHQCARMSDGTVRCMGLNAEGRLGNGRTNEVNVPSTPVPGLIDVEQVVTSDMGATCTRHRDGSVRCWGSNRYDMLGTGHVGDQDCLGRPCRMSPTLVDGLTEVVYLAVGNTSICAVRRDGGVWCWGAGDRLLPAGSAATPRATRLSDVAAMWPRALGWVWRRRDGRYASDTAITGLAIPEAAGFAEGGFGYHLCYRLPNTSIRCLGGNDHGKVGNGTIKGGLPGVTEPGDPGLCGVRSVATAFANTCALLYDGTVRCWGDGSHGALGCPTAEPCDSNGMAMRPRPVAGLEGVDRVFVGVWGGCAIRRDHSVWCWGTLAPHRYGPPEPVAW
ncbi:MAG: repeat domain protein [Myxococcaceae bacterium]|nr:repeat domain protein [Myxococcaceae bacterium]